MRKNTTQRRHKLVRSELQNKGPQIHLSPSSKLKIQLKLNKSGACKSRVLAKDSSRSSSSSVKAKCPKKKAHKKKPEKSKTPFATKTTIVRDTTVRAQSTQNTPYQKRNPCNFRLFDKLTRQHINN